MVDLEYGSDFVDCLKLQPPRTLGPVGLFNWTKAVAAKIKADGKPYDFVCWDTLSRMDELSEWVGTWDYMNSLQGKKFNKGADGKHLKYKDPDYISVLQELGQNGWKWVRDAMTDLIDDLRDTGKICTIFVCHVAEKMVVSKETNTDVRAIEIALTGKLRNIFCRDVDAIAYVYNKDGELQVSFKGNQEKMGGMRGCDHLQGFEGKLDWKQIFKLENLQ